MTHYIQTDHSSLVKEVYYEDDTRDLIVFVKYQDKPYIYENVPESVFMAFGTMPSIGRYFKLFIQSHYKLKTMADRPKTVNQCSDQKRFIHCSIDVTKINKEWLFVGEKGGVYLNFTLVMLPDGELDRYGNLGMITQDVPKVISDKEKDLEKTQRTRGEILGNGAEFARKAPEGIPGQETGKLLSVDSNINDDLPF